MKILVLNNSLKKLFPEIKPTLNFSNNWELFVSVLLSAQCTDKKVNEVTNLLFKKYKTLQDYTKADILILERDIYQTGFYKQKAKNLLKIASIIKEKYNGVIPNTMKEIIRLPGVGRKTANVVLGFAYGKVEGIPVDTHVRRLVKVFGISKYNYPEKIEKDLMDKLPKSEWFGFSFRLIMFGRKYCPARKHNHAKCLGLIERINI